MSDFLISPTGPASSIVAATPSLTQTEDTANFSTILGNAIQEVNELQTQAGGEVTKALTGEINDIHSAMIAVQMADISFQMMMQVRNKIVSAYQEIMRMQV